MDSKQISSMIEEIACFGKTDAGLYRLAFSDADTLAHEFIADSMRSIGLTVTTDAFGNLVGRLEGTDPIAPAVITGSHLDAVPEGGNFDGVVGVVGGFAAVARLKERGPLTHPLELIVFRAEESSRFSYATMGSKVMTGNVNFAAWRKIKDQDGISLADALAARGLNLDKFGEAKRDASRIKSFVELHIEQGAVLERHGNTIGVVEGIAAPTRLRVTVEGEAAHSGATPMENRRDALVSAAMIILAVQEIATEQSHRGTVGTVGTLKVNPGAMNVVPGRVEMGIDIRGVDHESIIETLQELKDVVSDIAEDRETPVSIEVLSSEKPVKMHHEIIDTIDEICKNRGVSYRRMNSGAGHDAMNMAALAPTGMIFIPCRHGISHNPEEYASIEDIMKGIDVLTETLYKLAK